ncbi:MAG: oligosaccharide flippase family protein [Alphaproteobacteria bacterium]|nr:oligosaccharide flippase family protein [Alphaproteobacteria bacterium]MBU1525490.1 oligosaccharide flippase family protein [Alphaproteobacteria bacterium]MBU2115976.1 oligosaccharide flippase family protein [Alphaproteobacteria bacterium]MBU2350892.1 oligosaccharide flippase family protein [Alphaproteobacteria bacterium]MBU2381727.1 oligosaccharide flippase family protein [Alphaproteobacteria bacterium]
MRVGRNASWNIAEVASSTVSLFLLLKIIVSALGVEGVGVWSLVLATTSLARLADVGVAGGLGKFVAEASARHGLVDEAGPKPIEFVETALLVTVLFYALVAALAHWPASQALALVLDQGARQQALALLPFALASLVTAGGSAVMGSALLGLNRSDMKSQIVIAGFCIQLALTAAFVPRFGLPGVAVAQIVQGLFVIAAGWFASCWQAEGRLTLRVPCKVTPALLRPLASFGIRLQAVNLAALLYDPIVKFLIAAVGGTAALGVFEMAFRLVTQSRQLLAAPSQNLLPLYVHAIESRRPLAELYGPAVVVLAALSVGGLSLLTISTPLISLIWLGRVEPLMAIFVGVLSVGWTLNTLAIPAFYIGLATGRLRWNIAGSVAATMLACLLGWSMGEVWGPLGVVVGASMAIGLGALLLIFGNTLAAHIKPFPGIGDVRYVWDYLGGLCHKLVRAVRH